MPLFIFHIGTGTMYAYISCRENKIIFDIIIGSTTLPIPIQNKD